MSEGGGEVGGERMDRFTREGERKTGKERERESGRAGSGGQRTELIPVMKCSGELAVITPADVIVQNPGRIMK